MIEIKVKDTIYYHILAHCIKRGAWARSDREVGTRHFEVRK